MEKVIIVGAGPAGISTAYTLSKNGYKVEIFEASFHVGGMSRSIDLWGQRVDLGPHRFFSKEPKVNGFFKEVLVDNYTLVNRLTRIYYNRRFFNYPLKVGNVLNNLGFGVILKVFFDYVKQRVFPIKNPNTFEEWVINKFGKKLYTIFFKHYTKKLWGIPCNKIDASWAAQRIKGLSLYEAVWSALKNNKGNNHKTLLDQFMYPKNGAGELYERAATFVENNHGVIHRNSPIQKIIIENGKCTGVITANGEKQYATHIVSTMPLTSLVRGIDNVPDSIMKCVEKLYFRNTILVYLEVDRCDLFKDNWIYIHSPDVRHGRITNFRNWCPSLNKDKDSTILCLEFWAFPDDDIWSSSDSYLSDLAIRELKKINIINDQETISNSKIIRIPKCYPVYEIGYQKYLNQIENYLSGIENLAPIGRYGSFKYNNQDHSILMGILAAENIIDNKSINLWEINTDTDYQEEAKIKDIESTIKS